MDDESGHSLWPDAQRDLDNALAGADEDFSSFLELGDFGLNLSAFDVDTNLQDAGLQEPILNVNYGANEIQLGSDGVLERSNESINTNLLHLPQGSLSEFNIGSSLDFNVSATQVQMSPYIQQRGYPHGGLIPPTPSSMELHAGVRTDSSYIDQTPFMERYHNMKEDQMVFTPLVSPAVTPFDSSFIHLPEFASLGAYFSPLNSPALEAQYSSRGHARRFSSSTSPIDPKDLSGSALAKKSLRRKSTNIRNPARVVRESPIMKPQRRKAPPPLLTASEVSDDNASPLTPKTRKSFTQHVPGLSVSTSRDNSSTDSISPEPLSEALMPPPPARSSANKSPYLAPDGDIMEVDNETGNLSSTSTGLAPATPASLMNISKLVPEKPADETITNTSRGFLTNDQIVGQICTSDGQEGNAATSPIFIHNTSNDTCGPEDEQSTPKLTPVQTSLKQKRLGQGGAGNTLTNKAQKTDTSSTSKASPSTIIDPKKDLKHTKRGSIHASPSLQPRISPSIKPLLPEGMTSSASALLLASKSNYENIVAGNHNHLGLSYPAHISTNLTSKRTSHKIAEQGRRNRINNALTEIAALLPATNRNAVESDANAQANSKASTVELAIDYIKSLQEQLAMTKVKLATVEAELEAYKETNNGDKSRL